MSSHDHEPTKLQSIDYSEYATPNTSHNEAAHKNEMPLVYTTVVRQEGQKVSVKIQASVITD